MSFRQPLAPVEVNGNGHGGANGIDAGQLKTKALATVAPVNLVAPPPLSLSKPITTDANANENTNSNSGDMYSHSTLNGHTPTSARTPIHLSTDEQHSKWTKNGLGNGNDARFSSGNRPRMDENTIGRSTNETDRYHKSHPYSNANANDSARRVRRHVHPSMNFSNSTPQTHSSSFPRSYTYSHTPSYPHPHAPAHAHPHVSTPYLYSPTPTLSYSPYDNSPTRPNVHPHTAHLRPHPHLQGGEGAVYTSTNTTTPTPASRARRPSYIATTPSRHSQSSAGPTPSNLLSQTSQRVGMPQTPTSWSSGNNSPSDCFIIDLPKPIVRDSQLELFGLEDAAQWQGPPPPRWLDGELDTVVEPPNMVEGSKGKKAWEKLCSNTRHFKSHNPWDYIVTDSRQHFGVPQKKFLECLWKLDASPSVAPRERLGAWLGCSSRRVTIFFQNRRQTFTKVLSRTPGDRDGSRVGSSFDDVFSSGQSKASIYGHGGRSSFGPVKLNCDPGSLDENWKWTGTLGFGEKPDDETIERLAIVYAITTGYLDSHCYYAKYMASRSPSGNSEKIGTPSLSSNGQGSGSRHSQSHSHSLSGSQSQTGFFAAPLPPRPMQKLGRPGLEEIMQARDQGLPGTRRSVVEPRRNEFGDIINLASFLPTDPPSEGPDPEAGAETTDSDSDSPRLQKPQAKQPRGERMPDMAIRTEKSIRHGRASAQDIYCSSSRYKAKALGLGLGLGVRGPTLPPLNRTMSMPSMSMNIGIPQLVGQANVHGQDRRPLMTQSSSFSAPRRSYPPAAPAPARPPLHTKPRDSFSRSRSAVDIRRSSADSGPPSGPDRGMDAVFEDEEQPTTALEEKGELVPDFMSEGVELLMSLSQTAESL